MISRPISSAIRFWKQWRCEHWWRPALTSRGPAKWCEDCDKTEHLNDAEFYAQFGRIAKP